MWIVLSRTYIMYEPTITREPVYPTASPIIQLHTTPARIPVRSIVAENLVFHHLPHDFQASVLASVLASAFASEKARVKEAPLLKVKKCMVHGSSLSYSCSTRDFKIPLIQVWELPPNLLTSGLGIIQSRTFQRKLQDAEPSSRTFRRKLQDTSGRKSCILSFLSSEEPGFGGGAAIVLM